MNISNSKIAILIPKIIKFKKSLIRAIILQLAEELQFSIASIHVSFVDKKEILALNGKYLSHHFSTDILTFNYSGSNTDLDGEIIISYEDAVENARRFYTSENEEYLRLIIHGILHLLGYDDQQKNDKLKMKRKETSLVKKLSTMILNKI
ncbi:MAG: rRNA maturation RNase YbeY [Ignavibacteria bacterium CG_4_8_14_3_um_filter_37_9]|nr:MAG: rRNA maturation RNase YbeY [Ignavibacteria bacterium CG_4_8_14_3_um_filter_37_9]PIX92850.1 MAG: rRNA maturation RNase YbeY [Ignavibacteria bacterium CG_4_10_14_3_um_filter_37_18]